MASEARPLPNAFSHHIVHFSEIKGAFDNSWAGTAARNQDALSGNEHCRPPTSDTQSSERISEELTKKLIDMVRSYLQ